MLKKFAVMFAAAIVAGAASAADLTSGEVGRFVATLPAVHALGEKVDEKSLPDFDPMPKRGEAFKPYSKSVDIMKKSGAPEYGQLKAVVAKEQFSPEDWASVGDRVMVAYLALKMDKEDPRAMQEMANMDPAMLDMMPANMRAQMEGAFAMIETVKNTPEADKKAVAPHVAAIDKVVEN